MVRSALHARLTAAAGVMALVPVLAVVPGTVSAAPSCPNLMVYGIQGTGQSAPNASTTEDTGFLSQVFKPAKAAAGALIDRAYVPYQASFGGAGPSTPGQTAPYSESVQTAGRMAEKMIAEKVAKCPDTKFGLVGYSQGAHAARGVMNDILDGKTAIKPEQVALVANFGDPGRPAAASLFPERPGQKAPSPVPGTVGSEVAKVVAAVPPVAQGGGIGPQKDVNRSVGELAGRYMSWCTNGDLACDAPTGSPLTHLVTNLIGQATLDQNDPIKSLQSIAQALTMTVVKAGSPITGGDGGAEFKGSPVSLAQRLASASDPRTPMPTSPTSLPEALGNLFRVGLIGGNAAVQAAPTKATDPMAALASAGAGNATSLRSVKQVAERGSVELVRPGSPDRTVNSVFDQLAGIGGADNGDLFSIASLTKYWDAGKAHSSYGTIAATPNGKPPTKYVADWIVAAAKDISRAKATSNTEQQQPTIPGLPILPSIDIPQITNLLNPTTTAGPATTTTPSAGRTATATARPGGGVDLGSNGALTGILPGLGGTSGSLLPDRTAGASTTTTAPSAVNVPGLGELPPFLVGK